VLSRTEAKHREQQNLENKNYEKDGCEKMVQLPKIPKGQKAKREQIIWPIDGKSHYWARKSLKSGNESVHSFFFREVWRKNKKGTKPKSHTKQNKTKLMLH
jgi:hypothetical protein